MAWKRPDLKKRMRKLLTPLPPQLEGYWIDIGTGDGVFAEILHGSYPDLHVIQMDISSYTQKSSLHFMGDLSNLPLRSNSIAGVVCAQVLHYIKHIELSGVLKSMLATVQKGGKILIIEYVNGQSYPWVPYHINSEYIKKLTEGLDHASVSDIYFDNDIHRPKYSILIKRD